MEIKILYSNYDNSIQSAELASTGTLFFEYITDEADPENLVQKIKLTHYDEIDTPTEYEFTKAQLSSLQKLLRALSTQL